MSEAPEAKAVVDEFLARQREMYAGGELAPLEELLADGVVWHVPGTSPIAGDYRGRDPCSGTSASGASSPAAPCVSQSAPRRTTRRPSSSSPTAAPGSATTRSPGRPPASTASPTAGWPRRGSCRSTKSTSTASGARDGRPPSVRADDELRIEVALDRVTRRSIQIHHEAFVEDVRVAEASSHYVCLDADSGEPTALPDAIAGAAR